MNELIENLMKTENYDLETYDILKEKINLMLATIFVQLLSHLYWFRSLSSEHIRSTFGALAMADWKKKRAG